MDYFKGQTKNLFGDVQDFFTARLNGLGTDLSLEKLKTAKKSMLCTFDANPFSF